MSREITDDDIIRIKNKIFKLIELVSKEYGCEFEDAMDEILIPNEIINDKKYYLKAKYNCATSKHSLKDEIFIISLDTEIEINNINKYGFNGHPYDVIKELAIRDLNDSEHNFESLLDQKIIEES